jgi:hypothetical protein
MGLPVAATNWSGPTEFLTVENGYPVALELGTGPDGDGLVEILDGPWRGHRWAQPSVDSLRKAMRAMAAGQKIPIARFVGRLLGWCTECSCVYANRSGGGAGQRYEGAHGHVASLRATTFG